MRTLPSLLTIAVLLVGGVPAARADSWMPYGKRRVPDPTGTRYVVVEGAAGGAAFSLVDAKPGAPRVWAQRALGFEEPTKDFGVREGDTVVATGKLPNAPLELRVSSLGLGFAAMVEHGAVGSGASFVWVGRDGIVKHVLRMADLFSAKEIESFTHTASSIWWHRAAWIDETSEEVVVVGNLGYVKVVSIATGKVRPGGDAEIRRGIENPDPDATVPALDLAIERKIAGLEPTLRKILADRAWPLGARLRAAVALAASDDRSGADLLRATALKAPDGPAGVEDRKYALANLARLVGDAAVPVLQAAMRAPTEPGIWCAGVEGFAAMGEKAVPALVAMLGETTQGNDYRGGAAYALGKIGSKAALPALLAAVPDREEYVASAALGAAITIGKDSISAALAKHLDAKTTQDGPLASYFKNVVEPASIGPLVRALERHLKEMYPRDEITGALSRQTDETYGPDLAAWKAWLARHAR